MWQVMQSSGMATRKKNRLDSGFRSHKDSLKKTRGLQIPNLGFGFLFFSQHEYFLTDFVYNSSISPVDLKPEINGLIVCQGSKPNKFRKEGCIVILYAHINFAKYYFQLGILIRDSEYLINEITDSDFL